MNSKVTEEDIRLFLLDRTTDNTLLDGSRFDSESIARAMAFVVDAFNYTVPITGAEYTVETFPHKYLLLIGTAGHLLRSASINEASNHLSYQAENVSVDDKNKSEVFAALGNSLWNEFKETSKQIKISDNINYLLSDGTIHSEFGLRYHLPY